MQLLPTRRRTNPAFWPAELRLQLGEERAERALSDPDSVDLLVWNVFASLETHPDRDWLAYRLQLLGGAGVRAPVRLALWTGARREPLLQLSPAYAAHVRRRAATAGGDDEDVAAFLAPVEVPVRVESPDVLVLVEATLAVVPAGIGGRDRLAELVDAGVEHARRLDKRLAVGFVYQSGTQAARELSARVTALRDPQRLARALPHRADLPPVVLREASWQQLLRVWEAEVGFLDLGGQPVRAFRQHCRARGLL